MKPPLSKANNIPTEEPKFSKLQAALWPIQKSELKKFLPMALMMFLVLFNYTLLRNAKDTLVITAPQGGAELIPFLKMWGVMPMAILFFFIYAKLSNILNRSALFYTCLTPFLVFFGAFAFLIYPNKEWLHPSTESVFTLQQTYPHLEWFIALYGMWSYGLFYILADLWGSICIALLFWQFANEITRTGEAQRFYSLFGFIGNLSLILTGSIGGWFMHRDVSQEIDPWGTSLTYIITAIVVAGVCILCLYGWMDRYVLSDPFYYEGAKKKQKEEKPKLSLKESLTYLFSSKYLGFIALLVISYGIVGNFMDVAWKSQIQAYFTQSNDYFAFMSRFSIWTGCATMVLIFLTKGIVRRFGWFTAAIVTPLVFLITGIFFFAFVLFKESLDGIVSLFGVTTVYMAVMIGAIQNILNKASKYSLFDPTKEMAYIPLDQELKIKGKAAVDVIGGRLGKSSGGFIQTLLLILTAGNLATIAPYLFGIFLVVMFAWIGAVRGLSSLYNEKAK